MKKAKPGARRRRKPAPKRVQVLMDQSDYAELQRIARRRDVSVGAVIRSAVRDQILEKERRLSILERIARIEPVELPDWPQLEREIEESKSDCLP